MTYPQRMRRVVLPQATRVIIPPTGNEFIAMMKDTALVGFLGVAVDESRALPAGTARVQPEPDEAVREPAGRRGAVLAPDLDLHVLPGPAGAPALEGLRPDERHLGTRRDQNPVPPRGRRGRGRRRSGRRRGPGRARPTRACRRSRTRERDHGETVVRVENLHKYFGPLEVLRGRRHGRASRARSSSIFGRSGSGQVDAAAVHQLPRGPHRRPDRGRGDPARGRPPDPEQAGADPPAPDARRDGLPAVQPVPAHDGPPERDGGARHGEGAEAGRGPADRAGAAREGRDSPTRPTNIRSGCPAGSSSAWRSPARWRWSPTSCSSTSRPPPSTPS